MKKENHALAEELRHELHRHPELSYEETWTKEHLIDFLKKNTDFEIHDGGKYFYAVYRTKNDSGKGAVAFRTEIDALPIEDEIDKPYRSEFPGVGHKCGHDGHAATLCGLALEIEEMKPDRDVYLLFQHAEEIGRGAVEAQQMLKDNPDVKEIFAFHNEPDFEKGTVLVAKSVSNCASKGMSIFLKGKPTHASLPENGINPVFSFVRIVDEIPKLIRPEDHKGIVLCTVVQLSVGEPAFGTAAGDGVLRMTIRGEYEEEMDQLQSALENLANEEAAKYGMEVRFEFQDIFPESRNAESSVSKLYRAAEKLGYKCVERPLERGSEDFGYYTKIVPGALFHIGSGEGTAQLHTEGFDFNDDLIDNAVEMFKALIEEA